jgi:hypothetical protein
VAYTNPTNGNSKFTIAILTVAEEKPAFDNRRPALKAADRRLSNVAGAAGFVLQWESAQGRVYSVYSTDSLSDGWLSEPDAEISGTGEILQYAPSTSSPATFFKVTVRLAE